jgi:hypothetical protein
MADADAFQLAALAKVPLADAALRLFDFVLDADGLAGVFDEHRGAAYDRKIAFGAFVHLIADSLVGHRGASAHRTFQTLREADADAASVQAAYRKLSRVPPAVSLALFDYAVDRLDRLAIPTDPGVRDIPPSLAAFRVLAFDGKVIKFAARKLKATRGLGGRFSGGKLLVAFDVATGRVAGVEADPDGEASDVPLVPALVARVRANSRDARPRLWVGDRLYCAFEPLRVCGEGGDSFVIRHRRKYQFHRDSQAETRIGTDSDGRAYTDETGTIGSGKTARRVRRIAVARPGEDDFAIVTDLADDKLYPAADLLAIYRHRWPIETLFQKVVQTFGLRRLIGTSPRATIFQAILCLILSNITHAVRDAVASASDTPPAEVSEALLFEELRRDLIGLFRMVEPDGVVAALEAVPLATPAALRKYLRRILRPLPAERWEKAKRKKKQTKQPDRGYVCGGHTSVDKALRGEHTVIPIDREKYSKTKPYYAKKNV